MLTRVSRKSIQAGHGFPAKQTGVALLEALIAVLIFSIGILAVLGLQAASIHNSIQSKYRTDANYLANQILGQMWVDQTNLSSYSGSYGPKNTWATQVASTLPNGNSVIAVNGNDVTVTITWQSPKETSPHNFAINAQIIK